MKIEFIVPGVPVAQPRARAVAWGGKARVYEPKSHPIAAFKATVRLAFQQAYKGPPLTGPLKCTMIFAMPRPKALIWKTRDMPRELHTKKPDVSNLIKGIEDALNGIAYVDDSQICQADIEKWIAAGEEQPHVLIILEELC